MKKMISDFQRIISQKNLILEPKDPFVVKVQDSAEGFDLAKDLLYATCDKKTVLFFSGGKTPKDFYTMLGKEEKLDVGATGLVDERYGEKMHVNSNEQMIQQSGLLGYLRYKHIPFYPILQEKPGIEDAAKKYDDTLRMLLHGFPKSIGILGIGLDGHTAGIPVNNKPSVKEKDALAFAYYDFPGEHPYRVSMTFQALTLLDIILVLVFGEDKKQALEKMFAAGSEDEIPARFFKRPEIAEKTLLITSLHV